MKFLSGFFRDPFFCQVVTSNLSVTLLVTLIRCFLAGVTARHLIPHYDSGINCLAVTPSRKHLIRVSNAPKFCSSSDPLMWWNHQQQEFPDLTRVARQYLAVPATSVSPQRFFSRVGLVQTDLCGSLLDTTIIDLMCAHTYTLSFVYISSTVTLAAYLALAHTLP